MNLYVLSLALGGAGLLTMAVSGLGSHAPGSAGSGHDLGAGHDVGAGHDLAASHGGEAGHGHQPAHGEQFRLLSLLSPRLLFSVLVGIGATGLIAEHFVGGPLLVVLALVGGIAFEALLVGPLWKQLFRFASRPALTLESSVADVARAVSGFDANGQGLIALELDGQVVQVLGTLRVEDRTAGVRVRSGDRLRIEEVDTARNRCTVSPLA
ncbi:MAG: hypothetical protein ABI637_04250 [Gemmatimonadota bacterium]